MRTALVLCVLAACGPVDRRPTDQPGVDAVERGPEVCNNTIDDNGDGIADCADPACSGVDGCPICGAVDHPEASPLALPDGVNSGAACTTDADCTDPVISTCISNECHASYVSTLDFIGFPDGAKLDDPYKLHKVCVRMEHSWLRDIQIELINPEGTVFVLDQWYDRGFNHTVLEIFLGNPNDGDTAATPVPGIGLDYCWTPTATREMINSQTGVAAPMNLLNPRQMPPGDYKPASPWTALTGSSLNGAWSMRVTDLWGEDNGFMFAWSMQFDPTLVEDCAGPIIL